MTQRKEAPRPLLTKKQAAAVLNISEKSLDRRIVAGKITIIKDGGVIRIAPEDLEKYIADRRSTRVPLSK
jgi:excisionase family DNA binding protein